jgi:cell division protein FtsZ
MMPEFAKRADRLLVNVIGGGGLSLADVKGVAEALLAQFGRESHVTVGAVVDAARSDVEIVVFGVSDLGARPRAAAARPVLATGGDAAGGFPATQDRVPPRRGRGAGTRPEQNEFEFGAAEQGRGHFDKTERNLFEGEDLDVPTYLRRGVKLAL